MDQNMNKTTYNNGGTQKKNGLLNKNFFVGAGIGACIVGAAWGIKTLAGTLKAKRAEKKAAKQATEKPEK